MKKIPLAPEGWAFIVPFVTLTILALMMQWYIAVVFLSIATLFMINFFRDPARAASGSHNDILSPADGTVASISELDDPPWPGLTKRISILMSIFDVHVNRAPATGEIIHYEYNHGQSHTGASNEARSGAEQNFIVMRTEDGSEIAFRQIAGLLARRIVFDLEKGARVARGERIGMIRFGSRVDVFLPAEAAVLCALRDKVKVGQTVIAELHSQENG